jgi:acetyl-CoA C-acetyltransferase
VRHAAIVSPLRGHDQGALRDVAVEDLAAAVVRAVVSPGPVPAVARLAARAGTDTRGLLDRMDLVELNEAFAVQVLAVLEGWGWGDQDRLNVNGSGISLGHPIGATGMRMVTTLLHELRRRGGGQGLVTMCVGGGQGLAATIEAA